MSMTSDYIFFWIVSCASLMPLLHKRYVVIYNPSLLLPQLAYLYTSGATALKKVAKTTSALKTGYDS